MKRSKGERLARPFASGCRGIAVISRSVFLQKASERTNIGRYRHRGKSTHVRSLEAWLSVSVPRFGAAYTAKSVLLLPALVQPMVEGGKNRRERERGEADAGVVNRENERMLENRPPTNA